MSSTYSGDVRATCFVPREDMRNLSEQLDRIPPFLFRTHSPKSSGETTAEFVQSTGSPFRYLDVLHQDKKAAREMIRRHLTVWTPSVKDNFMSWTSSLIFALQHAIRREATDYNPTSTAGKVKISILDTSKLPRGTFMPAGALLDFFEIPSLTNLRDYYHGEYLSQGRVCISKDAMVTTTLAELQNHGLFEFFPSFGEEAARTKLCKRVSELRVPFSDLNDDHEGQACSTEMLGLATAIAEGCCVDPKFRFVLFASLLSFAPRAPGDISILRKFEQLRWVWGKIPISLADLGGALSSEIPEHRQSVLMMRALLHRQQELDSIYTRALEGTRRSELDVTEAMTALQISDSGPKATEQASQLTVKTNKSIIIRKWKVIKQGGKALETETGKKRDSVM